MQKVKSVTLFAKHFLSLSSAAVNISLNSSLLQCLSLSLSLSLDSLNNTDLTSRLAQTNERMKKLSATFSSAASHDGEVMMEEEEVVVSARNSASDQTLVRTTRIRVVDPLDGMIESMIQKPEEVVPSPTTSSESYSTPGVSSTT